MYLELEMAWAATRPINGPLTGLFYQSANGPLQFFFKAVY